MNQFPLNNKYKMIFEISKNFLNIMQNIPKHVSLVCVSKTKPIEDLM